MRAHTHTHHDSSSGSQGQTNEHSLLLSSSFFTLSHTHTALTAHKTKHTHTKTHTIHCVYKGDTVIFSCAVHSNLVGHPFHLQFAQFFHIFPSAASACMWPRIRELIHSYRLGSKKHKNEHLKLFNLAGVKWDLNYGGRMRKMGGNASGGGFRLKQYWNYCFAQTAFKIIITMDNQDLSYTNFPPLRFHSYQN